MQQYSTIILLAVFLVGTLIYSSRAQKRQKEAQETMQKSLVKGATVETIGGLIALVDEVDDENDRIVLDAEGVYLTFAKRAIFKVLEDPSQESAIESNTADQD